MDQKSCIVGSGWLALHADPYTSLILSLVGTKRHFKTNSFLLYRICSVFFTCG